ncbi:hypothetical protein ABZ639_24630 [Saccharomonospora sp. NPDC006951]
MPFVPADGDSEAGSGGFVGSITSSVSAIDADAIAATKAETKKLLDAANSGGFRISPEGVAPLKDALSAMQDRIDGLNVTIIRRLGQAPPLGSHDYGYAVAAHDQKGGSVEAGSAGVVIEQLRNVIEDAGAALDKALQNFQESESQTVDTLSSGQE